MRSSVLVYSVFFLIASKSSVFSEAISLPHGVRNTTYGLVKGKAINLPTGKQVVQFLGIPYASAGRFDRPKKPASWNMTFEATEHGKSCPQPVNIPPFNLTSNDLSEDCLNLNIFAPNTSGFQRQSATNPVLFWLHGGGFVIGTSAATDASTIATEGNVVVVTANYRLGALGFFSIKEDGLAGNYGLLDVIEALHWVQNNIKSFGGDPSNVTLGGWSAGARLVGLLMTSPHANGLYERVLMMSGAAVGLYSYLEQEEADTRARFFGGLLRCPHPSSDFTNCLKRRSTAQFIEAQAKMYPSSMFAQWAPVVDGDVLPDLPPKLLAQGKFNGSSALIGVANDDGTPLLNDLPGVRKGVDVTKGMTREAFEHAIGNKKWIRNQDNKVPLIIAFQYTDWTKPNDVNLTRRQYLDLMSDFVYKAPAIQSANGFAKKGIPVFFYQTEYRENNDVNGKPIPKWINVPHRGDLRYIFPSPSEPLVSGFTRTMLESWINFIRSGTPNLPNQPEQWPHYTIEDQKYQALRSFPAPESKLRVEKMKFWNEFLPKNGMAEETPTATARPPDDSDDLTIALIVISSLFGICLIILLVLLIVLYGRRKESSPPATTTSKETSYRPPPKKPPPHKDEPKYQSTPHTPAPPYEGFSPYPDRLYSNSYNYVEKTDPYPPPSPAYKQDYYDGGRIDIVDVRNSPTKAHLDSDML